MRKAKIGLVMALVSSLVAIACLSALAVERANPIIARATAILNA